MVKQRRVMRCAIHALRAAALATGLTLWLCGAGGAFAQEDDAPTNEAVNYGDMVTGELSATAFFDLWRVDALAGDQIIIEMTGYDGLEPLIGILDSNGTLTARSEDATANGLAELEFTVPAAGEYTIVATRVGNETGMSTGGYSLLVGLVETAPAPVTPYEQVEFRCADFEVTTAASLQFRQPGRSQRIVVYGVDGFQPVIRIVSSHGDEAQTCTRDGDGEGDSFTLPGEAPVTVSGESAAVAEVDLTLAEEQDLGILTLTIGSVDGAPGRYIAAISGFAIETAAEQDTLEARLGPLAAQGSSLLVYMVDAEPNGRLDPAVRFGQAANDDICDDAGRRGCDDVPPVEDAGVLTADGLRLLGDRFDAGLRIPPGELASMSMVLGSFDGKTSGDYGLLLVGELPPRE